PGEERRMIFCQCAAVSEDTIERVIRDGAATVTDVTRGCGAGRWCPPCRQEIAIRIGILRSTADNAREEPRPSRVGCAA
ncbi:MAG: (2Fe-2S)-binding protein, partial [Candidatus Binatia bacterium]